MEQADVNILEKLREGGIGVLTTDTLYGLVGLALKEDVVERIYKLKNRQPDKPLIILIADRKDLGLFGVAPDEKTQKYLDSVWPGPVSVILPAPGAPAHLLRGGETLAFRLPNKPDLIKILKEVGPLVAPSANPEGLPPATNIAEAKKYFGDRIDFYLDGGELRGEPSNLVSLVDGHTKIIRG